MLLERRHFRRVRRGRDDRVCLPSEVPGGFKGQRYGEDAKKDGLLVMRVRGCSIPIHSDLRADNIVLAGGRVYFVDWPHASVGAPWVDLALFLPSVAMQGGAAPEEVFWANPLVAAATRDDLARVLAAGSWRLDRGEAPAAPFLVLKSLSCSQLGGSSPGSDRKNRD